MNPETEQLLNRLGQEVEDDRVGGHTIPLVERLSARGDPESLLAFLCLVQPSFPDSVVDAASRAIERIIHGLPPEEIPEFERRLRRAHVYWQDGGIENLKRRQITLERIDQVPGDRTALLCAMSCHGSRFVREAAVRRLARVQEPVAVAFLLLRACDGATAVRDQATMAIRWFTDTHARRALVWNRGLLDALVERRHPGVHMAADAIRALVRNARCERVETEVLAGGHPRVRRIIYPVWLESEGDDPVSVLESALQDPDALVRTWAARTVRRLDLHDRDRTELLEHVRSDPHVGPRIEWIRNCAERHDERTSQALLDARIDPFARIRQIARLELNKRGVERDDAAFFREHIDSARAEDRIGAIFGLGEVGSVSDLEALFVRLDGANSRTTRALLDAMASIDLEGTADVLVAYVDDPRKGVSACAARLLRPIGVASIRDGLSQLISGARHEHARQAAIELLVRAWR